MKKSIYSIYEIGLKNKQIIQKDWIMAIMYTVYLVNAVYGYAKWLKMNKVRNIVNE